MPIQIILQPGENITGSSLFSNLAYGAVSPGTANATIMFSYVMYNKTSNLSFNTNATNISKSFMFTISNTSGGSIMSSPLAQFKSGIAANNVKCQQGLQLVIKAENGNPACVKPDAVAKLVEWGWAKMPGQ